MARMQTLRAHAIMVNAMRREYDFSKSVRNPHAKRLKKRVTLRLSTDVITYFKQLAEETGIPYQNLINLYLGECAHLRKRPAIEWRPPATG